MNDIWHLILYFFVYSFIGWLWETVYCSLEERKFVYRGFLSGPYCPIYGFGVLILLEVLSPIKGDVPLLFLVSVIVMSIFEYVVSFVLEKLFHQRWWDYSAEKFNIKGRIALKSSLFWGVMCLVVIYVLQPMIVSFADAVVSISPLIPAALAIIVLIDAIYTVTQLAGFSRLLNQLRTIVDESPEILAQSISETVESLRKSGHLRFTERRLLRAFPRARDTRLDNYKDVRRNLLSMNRKKK